MRRITSAGNGEYGVGHPGLGIFLLFYNFIKTLCNHGVSALRVFFVRQVSCEFNYFHFTFVAGPSPFAANGVQIDISDFNLVGKAYRATP
jgi:hypothetical protein